MEILVRMENSEWMLLRRNVISQSEVELVDVSVLSCDRGYRVVRLTVCFCKNKRALVCITSPGFKDMVSSVNDSFPVLTLKSDN